MRARQVAVLIGLIGLGVVVLPLRGAASEEWTPTPGGWVSGALEYLETIPTEGAGASDATLLGDRLYVSSFRGFSIYDVSDPLDPVQLSSEPLVPALFNEQPQTNGEILLLSRDSRFTPSGTPLPPVGGVLDVWDVRDSRNPVKLGEYESSRPPGQRDHIWACVLDCSYAYSAGGTILDLSDPAAPTRAAADWTSVAPYRLMHHITEITPGILFVGAVPSYLLDARDPLEPRVLTRFEPPVTSIDVGFMGESIPARTAWPNAEVDGFEGLRGDRYALLSMETPFTGPCDGEDDGQFVTYDTTRWRTQGFAIADSYRLGTNGTYRDGNPPANVVGCSAYGFAARPGYGPTGRQVAVVFFEHGVRLLEIDQQGAISEAGGFTPHAGASAAPIWISEDVLYAIDLNRGIDILRVRG